MDHNYIILYASSFSAKNFSGSPRENEELGVLNIDPSSTNGLYNQMSFSKTDIPYLGESRVKNSTDAIEIDQFREKYDVNINLKGSTAFIPGRHFHLITRNLLRDVSANETTLARKFGFGGYYMITDVTHNIVTGGPKLEFITDVKGNWETSGLSERKNK